MDRSDIEATIRCYLDLPNDEKPIGWVGQLAQEIAAAHGQEVAILKADAEKAQTLLRYADSLLAGIQRQRSSDGQG